jgi:hypothetical protein
MTSVLDLIAEAERLGIRFVLADTGVLARGPATLTREQAAPLLDRLRQHRDDVRAILQRRQQVPDGPCNRCGGRYWWQATPGDAWTCGRCAPDPRAARWRGVTLATLGGRQVVLRAPAGDLPAVGEWCRLPGGTIGDLLAYTPDGGEALLRLFNPPGQREPDPPRFVWVDSVRLAGEPEWCGCRRRA